MSGNKGPLTADKVKAFVVSSLKQQGLDDKAIQAKLPDLMAEGFQHLRKAGRLKGLPMPELKKWEPYMGLKSQQATPSLGDTLKDLGKHVLAEGAGAWAGATAASPLATAAGVAFPPAAPVTVPLIEGGGALLGMLGGRSALSGHLEAPTKTDLAFAALPGVGSVGKAGLRAIENGGARTLGRMWATGKAPAKDAIAALLKTEPAAEEAGATSRLGRLVEKAGIKKPATGNTARRVVGRATPAERDAVLQRTHQPQTPEVIPVGHAPLDVSTLPLATQAAVRRHLASLPAEQRDRFLKDLGQYGPEQVQQIVDHALGRAATPEAGSSAIPLVPKEQNQAIKAAVRGHATELPQSVDDVQAILDNAKRLQSESGPTITVGQSPESTAEAQLFRDNPEQAQGILQHTQEVGSQPIHLPNAPTNPRELSPELHVALRRMLANLPEAQREKVLQGLGNHSPKEIRTLLENAGVLRPSSDAAIEAGEPAANGMREQLRREGRHAAQGQLPNSTATALGGYTPEQMQAILNHTRRLQSESAAMGPQPATNLVQDLREGGHIPAQAEPLLDQTNPLMSLLGRLQTGQASPYDRALGEALVKGQQTGESPVSDLQRLLSAGEAQPGNSLDVLGLQGHGGTLVPQSALMVPKAPAVPRMTESEASVAWRKLQGERPDRRWDVVGHPSGQGWTVVDRGPRMQPAAPASQPSLPSVTPPKPTAPRTGKRPGPATNAEKAANGEEAHLKGIADKLDKAFESAVELGDDQAMRRIHSAMETVGRALNGERVDLNAVLREAGL